MTLINRLFSASASKSHLICLTAIFLLCTIGSFGQTDTLENSGNTFIGANLNLGIYSPMESEIRVEPHHGFLVRPGLSFLFQTKGNSFFKIGVDFANYRSGLIDSTNYYEEYISVPVTFPIVQTSVNKENTDFAVLVGPEISIRSRAGVADSLETNYTVLDEPFGSQLKFGLVTEFSFLVWREKSLHTFGIRASTDLFQSASTVTDWSERNYFTAGFVYSFYFKL
ncbi:hypothetical protein [Halocola ammonii]